LSLEKKNINTNVNLNNLYSLKASSLERINYLWKGKQVEVNSSQCWIVGKTQNNVRLLQYYIRNNYNAVTMY
jgi:hypothetical protein